MKALIVEERLARVGALVMAMRCTVAQVEEQLPGASEACEWLHMMVRDELEKIEASLDFNVMNRDAP